MNRSRCAALAAALLLSACGGGGGTSSATPQTGVFIDAAVAGIGYRTATQSGVTDANGSFRYLPGETVTFFVGDIALPPIAAKGTITPFDLANSTDSYHPIALNVASFLQSLDADGDPSNGIAIPAGAAALATGGVDFNVPPATFAQNVNLIALVRDANPGANRTPVTADAARAHLQLTLNGLPATEHPDLAPVASAVVSATPVTINTAVTFSGQASQDPNGDTLTYRWSLTTRPDASQAALASVDTVQVAFTPDVAGTYSATLVVSDGVLESTASVNLIATNPPAPTPPAVTLTGISISQLPARIAVGGTSALTATATYSDSSTVDVTGRATWSSDAPATASVQAATGIVTGVAPGSANITASFDGANSSAHAIDVVALAAPVVLPSVSAPGQFVAQWNPVPYAQKYRIYLSAGTRGVGLSSTMIDDALIGQLVGGLTPGTTYYYRVGAVLGDVVTLSSEQFAYVYGGGQPGGTFQTRTAPGLYWTRPSAIRMNDGRVVILGLDAPDPQPVEIYDPVANSYARVVSPTGHVWTDGTATGLDSGKVLYAGGEDLSGPTPAASAETYLFDPATDTLTVGPTMPWAARWHTATRLVDGRVFIAGGRTSGGIVSNKTMLYDPDTHAFIRGPDLLVPREFHRAHLLHDGRVLLAAGANVTTMHATSEIFDPVANTITAGGTMAIGGQGRASAVLSDGRVLFAGGYGAQALPQAEVFDPTTDTFSGVGSMGTARYAAPATRLPNGKILIAGGLTGTTLNDTWTSTAEIFDPATNQFVPTGSMPYSPGSTHRAPVLLEDGRVVDIVYNVAFAYGP
ncbi:MAG: Ig-like domain-containing protein [Burkholderiaceae bacterium]